MKEKTDFLARSVAETIEKESILKKLQSGKRLRVKFGVDPTAADIHLGIAVGLRKLAEFQRLGHTVIFLIGDYTASIGDPSGTNKTRPMLSPKQIKENAQTYFKQAGKILDIKNTEIRWNSEWYKKMLLGDFLKIKTYLSLQRILERDDFQKRLAKNLEIASYEIDYPILQAYDSVVLRADIEIGGTDQKFNMLTGRRLMKRMGLPAQDIITLKLLVGTDGERKMSKSLGNYIGITEEPFQVFGKIMSLPDKLILPYFQLCTDIDLKRVKAIKDPLKQKLQLAFEVVRLYHGLKKAQEAQKEFEEVFQKRGLPSQLKTKPVKNREIVDVLIETGLVQSKSEARRLIEQNAVKIKDKTGRTIMIAKINTKLNLERPLVLMVGKRKFLRIKKG